MNKSQTNALGDVAESLQTFDLIDLEQYTREKKYSVNASKEFHLFYVGRDDVHDVLKHVLSRVSTSLYLNMFGFDDDELNDILMAKAKDPHVLTQSIFTDPDTISRFQSELIAEHMAARVQATGNAMEAAQRKKFG